jgi:putative transposase
MRRPAKPGSMIAFALRQADSGTPNAEVCRKRGVSEQTFCGWKRCCSGIAKGGPQAEAARGAGVVC